MYVYESMYLYYLLLLGIYALLFDKLWDLLMYLNVSIMHYILSEDLYVPQTAGVWIARWLSSQATTDGIVFHIVLAKIVNSYEI